MKDVPPRKHVVNGRRMATSRNRLSAVAIGVGVLAKAPVQKLGPESSKNGNEIRRGHQFLHYYMLTGSSVICTAFASALVGSRDCVQRSPMQCLDTGIRHLSSIKAAHSISDHTLAYFRCLHFVFLQLFVIYSAHCYLLEYPVGPPVSVEMKASQARDVGICNLIGDTLVPVPVFLRFPTKGRPKFLASRSLPCRECP